jgi:hypothetical protein
MDFKLIIVLFSIINNTIAEEVSLTVDKKLATITVHYADNKTITKPVLLGDNNSITPSGEFKIKKMYSSRLNEPMLVFVDGPKYVISIHPLWLGNPRQFRVERLNSTTPDDNYVTNGCINVDPNFFYNVLNEIPEGSLLKILSESN